HKYYLKAKINFRYIADAEMKSTAVTAKLDFNELKDMKDKLDSDLARVQQLIDKKSLEDSGK
ncbi:MAG: hypothetical protein QF406_04825, partial [Verrucomicrobiota bacterium]|nr:hypothetical protein [Verrucomicrobiota bacterium]